MTNILAALMTCVFYRSVGSKDTQLWHETGFSYTKTVWDMIQCALELLPVDAFQLTRVQVLALFVENCLCLLNEWLGGLCRLDVACPLAPLEGHEYCCPLSKVKFACV